MRMFKVHFAGVGSTDQMSEGVREVTSRVDCARLAADPYHQDSLEWLYMAVMMALCLETENEMASSCIGMIAECDEKYKESLSEFLENKVFKFMDERGEHHLSPHEHRPYSQDFDMSAEKRNSDLSRSGRDEVTPLLEQIKMNEKTISKLEEELHESQAEQEAQKERADDLLHQLDAKDNEILRLTDAMTRLADAVRPYMTTRKNL